MAPSQNKKTIKREPSLEVIRLEAAGSSDQNPFDLAPPSNSQEEVERSLREDSMESDDLSAYQFLTASQLTNEVETVEPPSASQFTFSGNLSLTPSSSPPVLDSSPTPFNPLGENPFQGWETTPPEFVCDCPKKAYVVFHGRKTGIFTHWSSVIPFVKKYPQARFKGYHTPGDAEHAYQQARTNGLIGPVPLNWRNHHFTTPLRTPCREVAAANASSSSTSSEVTTSEPPPPPCTPQNTARAVVSTPPTSFDARLHGIFRQEPPSLSRPLSSTPRVDATSRQFFSQKSTPTSNPPPAYSQSKEPTVKKEELTPVAPRSFPPARSTTLPPAGSPLTGVSRTTTQRTNPFGAPVESWWVVAVGNLPGVYFGRPTALRNAGLNEQGTMFECVQGFDQANEMFVDLFMKRQVVRLVPAPVQPPPSSFGTAAPPSLDPNQSWWVVPAGPNPGVYHGKLTTLRVAPSGVTIFEYLREREAYSAFVDLYMSNSIVVEFKVEDS